MPWHDGKVKPVLILDTPFLSSLDEWQRGLKCLGAETHAKLKKAVEGLDKELKAPECFENFYSYAFQYCLTEEKQRSVNIETICELLNIVLKSEFPNQVNLLIEYLKVHNDYRALNMDQWRSFYRIFKENKTISLFETTIKVLRGLLLAHLIASDYATGMRVPSYNNQLLNLAEDLVRRLLPAFDTPTDLSQHLLIWKRRKHLNHHFLKVLNMQYADEVVEEPISNDAVIKGTKTECFKL
ncbi:hypothetical protein PIB30_093202 [Stylosanthes scabra]|uniref:Defective in cullin neddylation protein n=1 Tax=Stylosanthes scabra TaxID=79078 RepID=A0ABU6ZUG0_9FABA|nr:hypothetical protein [Stylosanthes scabra]